MRWLFPILAITLLLCGCGNNALVAKAVPPKLQKILDNPDRVTLFTIGDEAEAKRELGPSAQPAVFRDGYYVIDSRELDPVDGKELIDSFLQGVRMGKEGGVACFNPHHAIRVENGDGRVDIMVCFQCNNFRVEPGGGNNNVILSKVSGLQATWLSVVHKMGMKEVAGEDE